MERFWSKVDRRGPDECWPWKAGLFKATGYGQFWDGRPRCAHTVAWELANGQPMPKGMFGLHTCDNRPCCNPAHVFPGTPKDNMDDMWAKGRARIYGGPLGPRRPPRGEAHKRAKLTEAQVRAIRSDRRPLKVIAAEHGIGFVYACKVRSGRSWRHVR